MSESQAREMAKGFDLHPAWRRDNRQIETDAIDFWRRLDILPPDVKPDERARELAAVAYKDGKLVGVTTVTLARVEQVRARLAMLRGATDPEYRRGHVAWALALYTRELIERWAIDHPEERVAGMGAIIESTDLRGREKEPVWPTTRFVLIGFTPDGRQIRISWFDDFRLD